MRLDKDQEDIHDLENAIGMTRGFSLFFVAFLLILLILEKWTSAPIPLVGVIINIVFWRYYNWQLKEKIAKMSEP